MYPILELMKFKEDSYPYFFSNSSTFLEAVCLTDTQWELFSEM